MSKHEQPMVERYWRTVGGTLFLEFPLVRKSADSGPRYLDALIVTDMPEQAWRWSAAATDGYTPEGVVGGQSVIAVQAKYNPSRLTMGLLGQTFFAVELLWGLKPATVRGVALCRQDDAALRAAFESFPNNERRDRHPLTCWARAEPVLSRGCAVA